MKADAAPDLSKQATEHRKCVESLDRLMHDLGLHMRPGTIKDSMALLCRQSRTARDQATRIEKALKEEARR